MYQARVGGLAPLVARALGGEQRAPVEPTGERILDAAVGEAAASGLHRLTMDAVARRAGVTRVTVYRHFSSRDRLVEALAIRETHRVMTGMAEAALAVPEAENRVVESFVVGLRLAREHPIIRRTAVQEPQSLIAALLANDGELMRLGSAYVLEIMRTIPGRPPADPVLVAETVGRLFASFLVVPSLSVDLDDDDAVRSYARGILVPLMVGPQ